MEPIREVGGGMRNKFKTPFIELTDDEKGGLVLPELLLFIPRALWAAFVIAKCWNWFMVPLGAIHITMAHAAGIDALISAFIIQTQNVHESYFEKIWRWVFWPAMLLGIAWVAKTAMTAGY